MRIALIRHPALLIEPGVCYGRLDVAVAPTAKQQIGRIAADPALQGAIHVWTSPAVRCRGLADAIAMTLAVPLTVDPRLQELDFGDWEGQYWDAIPRPDLDRWAAAPLSFAPPGGESAAALAERIRDFHAGLHRDQKDCVVVSHGGPLRVLTALLLGEAVDPLVASQPMGTVRIVG
jgi:alpha-ribazole phosphatase